MRQTFDKVGSAIRCCRALLKADGTPAAPLISWQDARVTRPYEHTNPDVAYVTSFSNDHELVRAGIRRILEDIKGIK
ncbi:hypothetical protein NE615_25785, partial [Escherichia coli]|nr:hypothetical protein [Escherichia coli]